MQDKKTIMHVLSALINNPSLLSNTRQYSMKPEDFPEKFHKIIFAAIVNLKKNNAEVINGIEIDGFLSNYDVHYKVFNDNDGLEYVETITELAEPENFDYHYDRLKKYSFLRRCNEEGIDVSEFYNESIVDPKELEEMQDRFDQFNLEGLIRAVNIRFNRVRDEFSMAQVSQGEHLAKGGKELLTELREKPDYGAPLSSKFLNTLVRGARKKKYYLRSGSTGSGKTRMSLADLLTICVSEIWDSSTQEWIKTGGGLGKGLFITSELENEEIRLPSLCYIADVEENKVLDGETTPEEDLRLDRAVEILEKAQIWVEYLEEFDTDDVEFVIEKYIHEHGVDHVAFDYIHTNVKMLAGMTAKSGVKLRDDQVLMLMSAKLKQIANRYNIWIISGTQLNNDYKQEGNLDASSLRGSRAIGDKLDVGMISLPVSEKDMKRIKPILNQGFYPMPNHVITLFKNRRGKLNNIQIWLQVNLGTLRVKDCFVTNMAGELLDVTPKDIHLMMDEDEEVTPEEVANT